ncbi:MAG: DUF3987 domain-containing protein, partial [Candidatus Babeliales bacterium]
MTNSNTSELCPQDLSDLLETCRQHMAENGLECQDPLNTDGNIHRYAVNDNTCKRNQWYVAHDGISAKGNRYLICVYGDWITGVKYKFISWNKNVLLNRESRKELNELLRKKQLETMSKLQKTRDAAATEAQRIWNESPVEPPSDEYLRYIKNKGIEPIGLRFGLNSNNYPSIIIDVKNIEGQIRSLQYISVDDNGKTYKTFFDGGELKGNFHTIGTIIDGDPIFVTEGYATGVSVHLATGIATVIAFSAHGLLCVIEKLKKKFAKSTVTIAGDNDKVGAEKATDAAKKICCSIALPIFPETIDPIPEGKSYTDFNDLHVTCGLDEVKRQLTAAALPPTEANRLKIIIRKSLLEKDACANFRISSLPKILGDYVSIISETTNAHPIMVTSSVLTTFTAFLEKRVFIPEGEYFQTLFPNLWILNVTKSGHFKSTALNKGSKLASQKNEAVTTRIKELEASMRTTFDEEEKSEIREEILKTSLQNVILPNKLTAEALLEHLSQGHNGVIFAGEFGGWLQNLDKNHNSDLKAIFTELYDVPHSFRYKTRTQGDYILNKPCFSICGVSTMAWLKPNLEASDVASGFFARFLMFAPRHRDEIPPALPVCQTISNPLAEEMVIQILETMDATYQYQLSESAKIVFNAAHEEIYAIQKSFNDKSQEILEPFVKRWSPYLLKLAMIMQLFHDQESKAIEVEAIAFAIPILLAAIHSTAQLFEGELGESDHQHKCSMLIEWI